MKLHNFLILGLVALLAASCNPFTSTVPAGILKTANGGADWQFANKLKDVEGSIGGLSISQIIFDPKQTDHIYAGTYDNGLFLSEDGGNTWRQILSRFIDYDFAVDPNSSDIIYAAGAYADRGRVVATRDGGKSWVEIFNEASPGNPVRSIALNPDNNKELIVGLGLGTTIKSEDAGVNWKLLRNFNDRINKVRWQSGVVYVVVRNAGLFKSLDGGANFADVTTSLQPANNFSTALLSPAGVASFNQVAVSRNTPDTLYLSTSSGIFQSFNGGSSWNFVALPVNQRGLPAVALAIAPSSDNVVYTSVGAVIYKTSDGGNSWLAGDSHTEGLVNALAVHPDLPQQALAGVYIP